MCHWLHRIWGWPAQCCLTSATSIVLAFCWQALRSLKVHGIKQGHVAAAANLTQLTRLELEGTHVSHLRTVSRLSALTGLQSLSLCDMQLEAPGLSLVAQGCSSLT